MRRSHEDRRGACMKTIACLAGDGVGPELMAAATRALDRVAELHSLQLDDVHLPFGGEARHADRASAAAGDARGLPRRRRDPRRVARQSRARRRQGRPRARLARRACAARRRRRSRRHRPGRRAGRTGLRSRARSRARPRRRGRVLCVGDSADWRAAVEAERARWSGLEVEEASLGQALVRLREQPGSLDVVVTEAHLVGAMVETAAHFAGSYASVAQAWLPSEGAGCVLPRRERVRRRRRLRRRRPARDAARRVADAGRGAQAPLGVADARAGGRRGCEAPSARRDRTRGPSPTP